MRRFFLSFFFFCVVSGYAILTSTLVDDKRQPTKELCSLAKICGMEEGNSLEDVNYWMQKNLLRQQERWEIQEGKFESMKDELYPLLARLGFIEGRQAKRQMYEGAIVHGALLKTARARLNTLIEEWKRGVRFTHLYFLSGERPLNADLENIEAKTEKEMMERLWEEALLPEEMRLVVKVHFINAPMKKIGDSIFRPTTEDTVKEWVKTEPPFGHYLAVSNAPYIVRQDLIMRAASPEEYTFETIGQKAYSEQKIAIFLDEVTRAVFILSTLF